jgi:hypothetical protein
MNPSRGSVWHGQAVRNSLLLLGLAAALVLGATACGGSDESSQTSASPTVTWADGVCSALSTYKTSLKETGSTLKSGAISTEGFEAMTESVKDATQTFHDDLQKLDQPQTQAAQTVNQTLVNLSAALSKDAETIRAASDDGLLNHVSVVSSTLLDAQDQVKTAVAELKSADAKGELSDAFAQAPACDSFPNL